MSFNFGQSTPSAFSFGSAPTVGGTPVPTVGGTAVPTVGGTATPTAGSTAGFSFGVPQSTGGFSFGVTSNPTPVSTQKGVSFGATPSANATPAASGLTGFSFGQSPAATPSTLGSPSTGFSFGSTPAAAVGQPASLYGFGGTATSSVPSTSTAGKLGFGLVGPPTAASQTTASAASTGFAFGPPPSVDITASTCAPPTAAVGGFSFGTPAASIPASTLILSGTPQPQPSTGFGVQAMPAASGSSLVTAAAKPTVSLAATATPSLSFNVVGNAASGAAATPVLLAGLLTTASCTTTSTASGLKLGTPSLSFKPCTAPTAAAALLTSAAATTKPPASFSFGTSTTTSTTTASSVTTTTTTSSLMSPPPAMTYRQLEEAINKWTLELEEQEKEFLRLATQVNAWDRLLIDNGEKITSLNSDVDKVKLDQTRLDHELDFIQAQQKELDEMLSPLEKIVEDFPAIGCQQHADLQRERTYQMAENIDAQLKRMVNDLKEIIEHLNTSSNNQDSNDPLKQISKILNAHMDSLQWVDQNTALVQRKVEEIAKLAEIRRRDQERNFKLAYE